MISLSRNQSKFDPFSCCCGERQQHRFMKHDLAVNLYFTAHRMGSGSSKRLVIQTHTANDALKNSSNLTEIVKPDLIDAQQIEDLGMKNTEKKPDLPSEGQRNEGNPSQPNSVTPNGNELSKEDKVEDQASKQESAKQKEVKEEGGKHEEKPVPQENKLTDEETTKKEKTNSDDHSALCDSFFKKYPSVKGVFQSLFNCYQELKEALNSENLVSSSSTVTLAERVFASYPNCKVRPNKAGLTDFALELGFPKLIHDIITTLISEYPEITSWDRAKDLESQQESTSASQGDTDEEKAAKLKTAQDLINNLIGAVLNFSDLHDPFCLAYSEAGMVPVYVRLITELKDSVAHNAQFVDPKTQSPSKYTVRGKILSRSLGTLHNLSKRVPVRHTFAACDAVGVLIPFLKAEVTMYATKALLVLAYLIDEENNHLIMADEGPIKFLTNTLKTAVTMKSHRFLGFSAAELAEGLTQIAVNDKNKRTIAQCGAIPVLTDMLINARDDLEKVNACSTLWTLAFDAENRKEIKANEKAVKKLRDLTSSKNDGIRQAAAGALWEVEVKEKHAETRSMAGNEDNAVSKHIMISYQWDVQSSMIQLKNRLQADGYKVWMDVDQMGGSTLESMAKAVEDACVVLIGVSQKYKESPNCRSEAEYTFQLHRDIIPLMVEKRYKPDGWLGMVVGSKFWIDFTDRHRLDSGIEKLKKELGNRGTSKGQDTVTVVNADTLDAIPVPSIKSWTHDDVKQWLVDLGLHGRMSPTAVKRLNGALLMRLQDLRRESPEFFYSSIRKDFGLANVFDVLEFTDELDKLVG